MVYAAVETGTGLWAASVLVDGRHFPPALAGLAMSFFYGSIMGGRFLTGAIASRLGNRSLVRFGTGIALVGGILFALAGFLPGLPALSILGLALLGLGCAPIYPCLMHETPRRYDRETARVVVGRQVAFAYIGGALVPPAFGLLAAAAGLEAVMPAVIAAALLLFGLTELLNSRT
jgi:fucose permease